MKPFVIFFIVFLRISAHADSSPELSLSDLTRLADRIDVARCVGMAGRWQGKDIVTDNTLQVLQNLKGDAHGQAFTVLTLGGTATHPRLKVPVKMLVPGGVELNISQEFLLFSKRMPDGQYQLLAFSQGLFAVSLDEHTGKRIIPVGYKLLTHQDTSAADIFNSAPALLRAQSTDISTRAIGLSEMIERIQTLL
jgi:hypothetical protein